MGLISGVVERLVQPLAVRVLLARERRESGVAYDLTSAEVREDPYPTYHELRRIDPVHRLRLVDAWVLTRYRDVEAVLRDHRRFGNAGRILVETVPMSLLGLDPPEHTRLRALVSKAFTPRAVAMLRTHIEETTAHLLDAVAGTNRFDLMAALAYPLPVTIIAEMLGVRPGDRDRFEEWSDSLALSVDPLVSRGQVHRIKNAAEEAYAYFETIIDERRRRPREDLVSALLAAEEEGDRLTHEELLSTMLLILMAGHETTRNLIGNGMLALLRNPHQMQRLRSDPELLDSAIDELLRYDSPGQLNGRCAREDVELGGKRIPAGDVVISVIGAANRDPEVFDDPDTLDIGRREESHLSFGRGIHYCLGAPLAVLEARIVFAAVLDRFASIRLAAEPRHRKTVVLRGVEHLWIEVERA
ncbi:MAG: cytochrome P450 [Spirochaetaceae bacterium]|nr:cytochrome P450 [Spirochaetaceae bacterium]